MNPLIQSFIEKTLKGEDDASGVFSQYIQQRTREILRAPADQTPAADATPPQEPQE